MGLLRSRPAFARLFVAGSISLVGDWLSFVAIGVFALGGEAGPLGYALVFAAHMLPAAIVAPLAGAVVDRFDRRRVLVAADVAAAVVSAGMALAAACESTLVVTALLVVRSTLSALVPPAEAAAVRRLVDEAELPGANALLALSWSVMYVVGMALGGLASTLGTVPALVLDALSFALAAGLLASLPAMPVVRHDVDPTDGLGAALRCVPRETAEALGEARTNRGQLEALLAKAPFALASGAAWVAVSALVTTGRPMAEGSIVIGWLQSLRGAGTGIGPSVVARTATSAEASLVAEWTARATLSVALLGIGITRDLRWLAALAFVWGLGTGTNWMLSHAALQRLSRDAVLGRILAFDELLVAASAVLGTFVGAAAVVSFGANAAARVAAMLAIAAWTVTRWLVGRLVRGSTEREDSSPRKARATDRSVASALVASSAGSTRP